MTQERGAYADVNGVHLYHEVHGEGSPLVLLHGGLMSGEAFAPLLPALTAHHQVVLVDLQGHGRTADVDRPLDVRLMADDVAALIEHLGLDRPAVVGFSLGGGVALQVAVRHPELVGRLVACSAAIRTDAVYAEMRAQQGQVERGRRAVHEGHPDVRAVPAGGAAPGGLRAAAGQDRRGDGRPVRLHRGRARPAGADAGDGRRRRHGPAEPLRRGVRLLGGGQRDGGWGGEGRPEGGHALAILPGTTHYDVADSPLFAAAVLAFLSER